MWGLVRLFNVGFGKALQDVDLIDCQNKAQGSVRPDQQQLRPNGLTCRLSCSAFYHGKETGAVCVTL